MPGKHQVENVVMPENTKFKDYVAPSEHGASFRHHSARAEPKGASNLILANVGVSHVRGSLPQQWHSNLDPRRVNLSKHCVPS